MNFFGASLSTPTTTTATTRTMIFVATTTTINFLWVEPIPLQFSTWMTADGASHLAQPWAIDEFCRAGCAARRKDVWFRGTGGSCSESKRINTILGKHLAESWRKCVFRTWELMHAAVTSVEEKKRIAESGCQARGTLSPLRGRKRME